MRSQPLERSTYDVAFYVPTVGPLLVRDTTSPAGGAETQVFLVAKALAARGVSVCLSVFADCADRVPATVDGVTILAREPYQGGRGLEGVVEEALATYRAFRDIDAPVVVTRIAGPHVALAGALAKLGGQRFVYSSASLTDFDFAARAPSWRDRSLYRIGLRLADQIVVQTSEQSKLCRERFGRKVLVVPSLVELAPRRSNAPEAFLWAGRVAWYKGPLEYVELARAVPAADFWMVPVPGRESEDLMEKIRHAALGLPNLKLLSPMPRAELLHHVERAVAVVNTSAFEGMPNVTLEGWARGVPALTLSYDPDGLIRRHALGSFANGSPVLLAEQARALWRARHDQTEVANRCRSYVRDHHSARVVCSHWELVIEAGKHTSRRHGRSRKDRVAGGALP